MSLQQVRGIYPEYSSVSDEGLIRKIKALFWPEFSYDMAAKQLLENRDLYLGLLGELYAKRGDAYLRSGDFRRGVLDFNRIFKGIPNFADTVARWRLLGTSTNGQENYVDVKSVEFPGKAPARLWVKTVNKNKAYTDQFFEIDCPTRRINLTSTAQYDKDEHSLSNSQAISGWQRIVPDTMGEQLYSGMCSASP